MSLKSKILISILLILYTVGVFGILTPQYRNMFLALSDVNLYISFIILLIARNQKDRNWYLFIGFAFLVGMLVEWVGVHTGYLFGNYEYGQNLGRKFDGIPYVIGCNWALIVVSSATLAKHFFRHSYLTPFFAAIIMVIFDLFMEPVAISSDFWSWTDGYIPIYNYVCWFIVGLFLQLIYHFFKLNEANKVNDALFIIMTLFFIILNIF
jgi:putative membrane protein